MISPTNYCPFCSKDGIRQELSSISVWKVKDDTFSRLPYCSKCKIVVDNRTIDIGK